MTRSLARGTLSRRLILASTALVAAIAILLSGLTTLTLHRILEAQLDQQLIATAHRTRSGPGEQPRGGPGQVQGLLRYVQGGTGYVQVERDSVNVDGAELSEALDALPVTDRPETVALPGLGRYRVIVGQQGNGVGVIGLPTAAVDATMASLIVAASVLTALAIAIAFLAARAMVERNLRPLARLTATAHQVSNLTLDSGEVAMPVRVAPQDTDPRSEVGQVGLAFNHMLDNVEGALGARQRSETKVRQFVADASHELRNPLASIRGYAELTRRERDDVPPTTAHALSRIESESERMSRLVEDLLLLARLDSGPAIDHTPVDLGDLVANAVSDARAAGPDHHWEMSVPDADIDVIGDRHRLHQVVANLLGNARTHTPAGTHIRTSLTEQNGFATIAVADDGPGIPPEVIDRVFERFARADTSRVRSSAGGQSTGLGLAIVSAVVQAHGGEVGVQSVPGTTIFTVRLPIKAGQPSNPQ